MDQQQKPPTSPLEVFVSYADGDEEWRDKLLAHLHLLALEKLINIWHRGSIAPGMNKEQETNRHLETFSIMLLLMSPNFINSGSCWYREMGRALERYHANEAQIFPIVTCFCDWGHTPVGDLQCLPRDGKPIKASKDKDAEWVKVIKEIRTAIEKLNCPSPSTMASLPSSVFHVPYNQNKSFTGREETLALLRTELCQKHHIQAISGLGGIGKTELVVEYAHHHKKDYRFVLWAQADSTENLTSSYTEIAADLNLPSKDIREQDTIIQAVKTWLKGHQHYLLILDNVEKPELLSQFVPQDARGHLLLTTQNAHLSLLNLGVTHTHHLERFTPEQGVRFLQRILDSSKVDLTRAEQLVKTLDGLPLALDQAGTYLRATQTNLADYLDLYERQSAPLLEYPYRGRYHNSASVSVAATLKISIQNVAKDNPAAADLLRLCAFLAPDAIPEAIFKKGAKELGPILAPVAANDLLFNQAITDLRNYSLIDRNQDEDTLIVHRIVQDVLRSDLSHEDLQRWKLRAIQVVNTTLPHLEHANWALCEKWLLHAVICDKWIREVEVTFQIARFLPSWIGSYLRERARYNEAKPYLEHALNISEFAHKETSRAATTDLTDLSYLHWNRGEYEEAEKLLLRAQAIYEGRLRHDGAFSTDERLQYAEILQNLACTNQTQGKYQEAGKWFQQALKQADGASPLTVALIQSNQAELYRRLGRYEEADVLLKKALAIYTREWGLDDPKTSYVLHKQALLSYDQGRDKEAEQLLKRILVVYQNCQGPEHPDTAQILHSLAEVSRVQNKYEEAEELFNQALTILKQKLGEKHSSTAAVLNGLALLYLEQGKYVYVGQKGQGGYMKQGRYEEAEKLLQDALNIREDQLGPKHPDVALCLHNLALLYSAQEEMYNEAEERFESTQEKYKRAEELFEHALAIWQKQLSPEHPYILHTLYHLGRLSQAQGNYEKANDLFQHLLKIQKCRFDQEDAEIILRLDDLAFLSYDQKRYEEAEMYFQQILAIYEECLGPKHLGTQDVRRNFTSLLQMVGRDLRFPLQIDENISDENS